MEIIIYYLIPNLILFGSLFLVGKYIENASWEYVVHYDEYSKRINNLFSKK